MCVISKDSNACSKHIPRGKLTTQLATVYALPPCLGNFPEDFWNCRYRYFPAVQNDVAIERANLNVCGNARLLATPLHDQFARLWLAFKPTNIPNQYRVKTFPHLGTICNRLLPEDGFVTLTSHATRYALPHLIIGKLTTSSQLLSFMQLYGETDCQHRDCCTTDVYRKHCCSSKFEVPVYRTKGHQKCDRQKPHGNTIKSYYRQPKSQRSYTFHQGRQGFPGLSGFSGDRSAFCTKPWQGLWIPLRKRGGAYV